MDQQDADEKNSGLAKAIQKKKTIGLRKSGAARRIRDIVEPPKDDEEEKVSDHAHE